MILLNTNLEADSLICIIYFIVPAFIYQIGMKLSDILSKLIKTQMEIDH
jgi:hypothetical protein